MPRNDRDHRYNVSPKGLARNRKVAETRIRVKVGGQTLLYRVPRGRREELAESISAFRDLQRKEHRGRFGQTVP